MIMNINIVVPPLQTDRFTGGIWCVMQHAQQLGLRGHRVTVVPTHPSALPRWLPQPWSFTFRHVTPRQSLAHGVRCMATTAGEVLRLKLSRHTPPSAEQDGRIRASVGGFGLALAGYGTYGQRMGAAVDHLRAVLPDADLTLATDTETVWPVRLVGRGVLAYFAQHYEPYFWKERMGLEASRQEALASYQLGLNQLANSPWLQDKLQRDTGCKVALCPNAIDHAVFRGQVSQRSPNEPLRIISYGGRGAEWKGFREMCEAMRLVHSQLGAGKVEWSVYGDALLPSDNPICPYKSLGFLNPEALAEAYRQHHVLLSASWYESFPLFPIEAMACGLTSINTQPGTEAFAEHGETAWIVTPRDPQALATAIFKLAGDELLRQRLARNGQMRSSAFTWDHAGAVMEAALERLVASAPESAALEIQSIDCNGSHSR